jgi:riboflavin transporter FmnP
MITTLAALTALALVLLLVARFPIFASASFLKYEPMDIPFLIAGFAYGPLAGLAVTTVASVIQGIAFDPQDGIVGIVMHIAASGTLVLIASFIYKRRHTFKSAIFGLAMGTAGMAIMMVGFNLVVTTWYYEWPIESVIALLPLIIAFNLIKAGANSAVTLLIYKPLRKFIIKGTPRDLKAQQ